MLWMGCGGRCCVYGHEVVVVVVGRGVIGDVVIVAVDVAYIWDSPNAVYISRLCQMTQHLSIRVRHWPKGKADSFSLWFVQRCTTWVGVR